MNVALDTTATYTSRAGAARYIRGLQRGFQELNPAGFRYAPVAWEVENLEYRQPWRALKTFYREFIWAPLLASGAVKSSGADLLHSPSHWFIKPPGGLPHVVTLLDLALIRFPERFRPWLRRAGRNRLRHLPRADKIICISQFTADEAMELLGLPASKLEPVHLGIDFDPQRKPDCRPNELPDEPFFLFVGSLEPGKNLRLLREAYEAGNDLPALALAGARWVGVADEGPPPKNWHYLGHVSDDELQWLYQHALGLVFPSKYEGFGLPMVEAMALGCPVVASRVGSLPEIGQDAVRWAEVNPSAYGSALRELADDTGAREQLREAGRKRAGDFSWRKCAEQTFECYRGAVA